jgi:basic membrane lipoprotein Med (substrate-binding protein (PBP1-ABC) superfamily)
VSDRYPEVAFLECNGGQLTDNKVAYYINHWDPSYLIGMMAGLLSKTGKLGYVASFPIDSVYTSVNSFTLGARSVNPNATCTVVAINSWFDPSKAKQAAEALVSDGCDFLFGIMDEAAYLQVAEKEGIWAAMWNTDIRRFGPNAYVSSIMLDWNKFYLDEAKKVLDGTWEGNRLVLLPMGEGVDRDSWGKNVPEQLQWMVDAVRDHMLKGWSPFVGPIKDKDGKVKIPAGEKLTEKYMYDSWLWSVEGVSGMPK